MSQVVEAAETASSESSGAHCSGSPLGTLEEAVSGSSTPLQGRERMELHRKPGTGEAGWREHGDGGAQSAGCRLQLWQ
jgi:hypothetical protein